MKTIKHKELLTRLGLLGGCWLIASLLLRRNGFTYSSELPFDWQGIVFMIVTISIAVYGFTVLKASQRNLKYNFTYYGLAWLIPLIIIGSVLAGLSSPTHVYTAAPDYCSTTLLPSKCHLIDEPTGKELSTTYQSGYGVTIVFAGAIVYSVYRSIKTRIKGHRHEDLFQ